MAPRCHAVFAHGYAVVFAEDKGQVTLAREVAPLVAAARHFGIPEAIVVTRNEERLLEYDGTRIAAIPV